MLIEESTHRWQSFITRVVKIAERKRKIVSVYTLLVAVTGTKLKAILKMEPV